MQEASRRLGTLSGLGAILLWSTTIALQRSVSEQLGRIAAPAAVFLLASLISALRVGTSPKLRNDLRTLPLRYLVVCGALFVCNLIALFTGVALAHTRQEAIQVGLLNYLWPATTLFGSVFILGRRASWLLWPGTVIALAGVFVAMTAGVGLTWTAFAHHFASNPVACLLGLTSAVTWGIYSNLTRRWAGAHASGAVDLFLPAAGLVMFAAYLAAGQTVIWTPRAVTEAAFLGVSSFFAYRLWDVAMRRGSVVLVAAISYLTPLLSTLCSALYLRLLPPSGIWLGTLLIVAGSLISWRAVDDPP